MSVGNIDKARSYATEAKLLEGLKHFNLSHYRPVIVRNREGRWTAIFGIQFSGIAKTGVLTDAAQHNFLTIN